MTCAAFEDALTRLVAGEVPEAERETVLARLEGHAGECATCAGTLDLLELMGRPAGERDLATDPGPAYWADFDARLAARIRASREIAPPIPAAPSGAPWAAAAAALLLAAGLWWASRPVPDTALTMLIAENVAAAPEGTPIELPGDLASRLDNLDPERAVEVLSGFGGLDDAWPLDVAEPETDAAFDELLVELGDADRLGALDEWLPGGAAAFAVDSDLAGLVPFPDAQGLDASARKELLRWLTEQV